MPKRKRDAACEAVPCEEYVPKQKSAKKKSAKKKSTKKKSTKRKAKVKTRGPGSFKVKKIRHWDGTLHQCLCYTHDSTIAQIRSVMSLDRGDDLFYIPVRQACLKMAKLRRRCSSDSEGKEFLQPTLDYLENTMAVSLAAFKSSYEAGEVTFDDLWLLFLEDAEIYFHDNEAVLADGIKDVEYRRTWFGGMLFNVTTKGIAWNGEGYYESTKSATIREYEGVRKIRNLPVKPLDEKTKAKLLERGRRIAELIGRGVAHLHYSQDLLYRDEFYGPRWYRAVGRCMVDAKSFKAMNEDYNRDWDIDEDSESSLQEQVEEDHLWRLSPWMLGFSFAAKRWGEFNVENLAEVSYNEDAFDRLVLPPREVDGLMINPKPLIRALVEKGSVGFSDIIAGKGGGIIFALHGGPGTGKTLTAESIADLLHRPLYSVSVGELGTTAEVLEKNLRRSLEMAELWDAVLLIDEADIFMEKRTARDIERNALVAIFLRLLEYYQGVMFVTTNRVESFDRAFNSRLSLALHYPDHNEESREQIWIGLLDKAEIRGIDPKDLAKHDVNGRQIKHSIRIALSLASAEERDVTENDLLTTIKLAQQFNRDLEEFDASDSRPGEDRIGGASLRVAPAPSRRRGNGRFSRRSP